ncbi:MAG: aspartate aminotransferase family protein [Planctomycetes bacterium]|nr:aspartate aminotransferase family protein [Planctomycetota bacterium]
MPEFGLLPREVPAVETAFRRIRTRIPVPESIPIIEKLHRCEPRSMRGQPPIIWDRAEGFRVFDPYGNVWIDWSSGVLVANAGHGREEIRRAVIAQAERGLLHNYCFPSAIRAELAELIVEIAPEGLDKVFLLTTGSEATENVLKLSRMYGAARRGSSKRIFITFDASFHGRTLGAQLMGGIPKLKGWISSPDPDIRQVPFPDGFRNPDTSFDGFLAALRRVGAEPEDICGICLETYQGGEACFAPPEFIRSLHRFTREHDILLIFDEVQAAFGRTGTLWGFEHYGVVPDLACLGKGITSSLPLSCVLGRADVMDLAEPGSMTSTHTGNPVCCAAAIANIRAILRDRLWENAARMEPVLRCALDRIRARHPDRIGTINGKGLVAGVVVVRPGSREYDRDAAFRIVERVLAKGLMLFAPVGGATIKISPPLVIPAEAIEDGAAALGEAFDEIIAEGA